MRILKNIFLTAAVVLNCSAQEAEFLAATVTVGGGDSAWITTTPATSWRNNFDGCVGSLFTTDGTARTVTQLGLYVKSGNTATVTVKILDGLTVIATAEIDQTGLPEGYYYMPVTPAALAANTSFVIARTASNGLSGDNWPDEWAITTTGITSSINAAYATACVNEGDFVPLTSGSMFSAVNFKYTTP